MDTDRAANLASAAADALVAAAGVGAVGFSFLEIADLMVRILVGLATLVLVILRIRAHLRQGRNGRHGTPLIALVAVLLFLPWRALASPPPNADPSLGPWFRSLTSPAGESCCAEYDGHVLSDADWRVAGDHYEVRIAKVWRIVPAAAVLNRVDNPTGGAVVFYPPSADSNPEVSAKIYCFVRPVEG